MEKKQTQPIIEATTLLLCPNCKTHFPEIKKLKLKNKKIEVIITCDNCNELHHGKSFDIETLINCNYNDNVHVKQCYICEKSTRNIKKVFCITCEKWICQLCIKDHDEYIMNDLHEMNDKRYLMHCFCDREVYFRHKCCIHHKIKPIDKNIIDIVNKGTFQSIETDGNDISDTVSIASHLNYNNVNNMNYNYIYQNNLHTITENPGSESISYNNETDAFSKTGASPSPGSYTYCNMNNNDNNSTIDNSNVIYDDNYNIIANYEGNVYAEYYCQECNLYFCESCAIDHEYIMKHKLTNDNEDIRDKDEMATFQKIISGKNEFLLLIHEAISNIKDKKPINFSQSNMSFDIVNANSSISEEEQQSLKQALEFNEQFHNNYVKMFEKVNNSFSYMNKYNSYNQNIIKSFKKLSITNNIDFLSNEIKVAQNFFHTLHIFLKTKSFFKIERISCFEYRTIPHNGVTSMIYFRDRLYTGGKRMLKKWKFPYATHSSATLLKTKDGDLTGRINCFCKASDTLILAGTENGNILLCEFGKDSGIRITATDRKQPILCMLLLNDEFKDSNRVTSFLLSDIRGIWEISIESRKGKTMLSEVEFFKTRDECGKSVPVRALIAAKGTTTCFLLGGLDYIYPKFRGNTLIKIQDSIKCSERNENKLISCMTYVEGTSILVVGGYDCCVGALVLDNPQQRSRYKEITRFRSGVVSILSNRENEIIALSAGGEFKIINISVSYEGMGFQWEEIATFRNQSLPSVGLIKLQTGYIAMCGCDKIEIWYLNV